MPGLEVAVHGHPNADTLLLWHPEVRSRPGDVAQLATRIAGRGGFRVVVPTWSDGRDLLRSVRFARETAVHKPDDLSIVGYGAGGIAALGLAENQRRLGIGLSRVTCVDGGPGLIDPVTGREPADNAGPAQLPPTVTTKVDVVAGHDGTSATWAADTAAAWAAAGWDATLVAADQFTWRL